MNLEWMRTLENTKIPDRGKASMALTSHATTLTCIIMEQWSHPPSQAMLVRERRAASASCGRTRERTIESDHSHC